MQNLPVTLNGQGGIVPQLPSQLADALRKYHEDAFADLGGRSLRRIKIGLGVYSLIDGSSTTEVPRDKLFGVIIGVAPCNHAVWYARKFQQGQTPSQPDLVWKMPTMETFPDALPMNMRQKEERDGRKTWPFTICRRVAFCLLRATPQGVVLELDKPYIMDLTSMSLWGRGLPQQGQYTLSGLQDACRRYSGNGVTVTPMMFYTQIVQVQPQGVVNFRPQMDGNGNIIFLTADEIQAVYDCAMLPETQAMLDVREILDYSPNGGNVAPVQSMPIRPVQPATSTTAPAPQPAPQPAPAPAATPTVGNLLAEAQAMVQEPTTTQAPSPAQLAGALDQAAALLNNTGVAPVQPAAPAAPSAPAGNSIADGVNNMLSNLMS